MPFYLTVFMTSQWSAQSTINHAAHKTLSLFLFSLSARLHGALDFSLAIKSKLRRLETHRSERERSHPQITFGESENGVGGAITFVHARSFFGQPRV
jgi:hypothetical protein